MAKEKVPIDFHYFIQMTIQKDMTWNTLSFLLTDLAETQKKSKQGFKILVMELKEWVSKVENDSKLDVTEMFDTNEKVANVQIQEDHGEANDGGAREKKTRTIVRRSETRGKNLVAYGSIYCSSSLNSIQSLSCSKQSSVTLLAVLICDIIIPTTVILILIPWTHELREKFHKHLKTIP